MAVKAYALTTLARLKTYLDITGAGDDTLLETIIDSVTEFIENYCHRRFQQTAISQEMYSTGRRDKIITLKQYPVASGETFTLEVRASSLNEDDWEEVDSEYYHVHWQEGIIEGAGGYTFIKGVNKYRVTYTAGYDFDTSTKPVTDTEAGDLELAMWMLCKVAFLRRKGDASVKSERIGDYAVVYMKEAFENETIRSILDKYRRISSNLGVITGDLT